MGSKCQHDQIRIRPINTMTLIRIITIRGPLLPYKLHNLMFPLSGTVRIRKDHSKILP